MFRQTNYKCEENLTRTEEFSYVDERMENYSLSKLNFEVLKWLFVGNKLKSSCSILLKAVSCDGM